MKPVLLPFLLSLSPFLAQAQEEKNEPSQAELTRRASLALGYQEGVRAAQKQMRPVDFDTKAFLEGFLKGLEGQKLSLSPEEIREAMGELRTTLTSRETETAKLNLQAGEKFLKANKEKSGVIVEKSGLQYRVLAAGKGEPFGEEGLLGKEIFVNYRGTLPDGTEIASSGEISAAKITLDDVIAGVREALSMMRKGARWKVFVPSELAYGEQRRSAEIGPNQLLVFEIELVGVTGSPDEAK